MRAGARCRRASLRRNRSSGVVECREIAALEVLLELVGETAYDGEVDVTAEAAGREVPGGGCSLRGVGALEGLADRVAESLQPEGARDTPHRARDLARVVVLVHPDE